MADAVRRIDVAALGRATNQIGMNRALNSVIAGFERETNRLGLTGGRGVDQKRRLPAGGLHACGGDHLTSPTE